ncbi:hypothetical protein PQR34_46835 [Paraburkholderia sediminicola]|uniref:hypothetical protein n=1 Tax=Paraburkholderia sediminicola TaxID=458836 RepID=UPI0038BB1AC1
MNYQFNATGNVLIRDDGVSFPVDERSSVYQEYLLWVEEGNVALQPHASHR